MQARFDETRRGLMRVGGARDARAGLPVHRHASVFTQQPVGGHCSLALETKVKRYY